MFHVVLSAVYIEIKQAVLNIEETDALSSFKPACLDFPLTINTKKIACPYLPWGGKEKI